MWTPVHLNTCPSEHLSKWTPVHLNTCPSEHLSMWTSVHLDYSLGCSTISGGRSSKLTGSGGASASSAISISLVYGIFSINSSCRCCSTVNWISGSSDCNESDLQRLRTCCCDASEVCVATFSNFVLSLKTLVDGNQLK